MANLYRNYVYQWEGDTSQPYPNDFTWKSRKWIFPYLLTFNCLRVIAETGDRADYYDSLESYKDTLARNTARLSGSNLGGSIGEDPIGELSVNGDNLEAATEPSAYSGDFNLTINIYLNGTLHFTKDIYALDKPIRIPGGIKARDVEIEVTGNVTIKRIDVATSMRELMT